MAKGKNRNGSKSRVVSPNPQRYRQVRIAPIVQAPVVALTEIEDRRSHRGPPRSISGANYSLVAHQPRKNLARPRTKVPYQIAFSNPRQLMVCLRRNIRKRVIHAIGKAGRGNRKPRRNAYSNIRC